MLLTRSDLIIIDDLTRATIDDRILIKAAIMDLEDLVDLDFLVELEGYRSKPYVLPPERFPSSGITLGFGVDLGQWTAKDAKTVLEKYLPEEKANNLLEAIKPFFGKKGEDARRLIQLANNVLTPHDVLEISIAFLHYFVERIAERIPNFFTLDKKSRTAIVTIAWHRGLSVLTKPSFFARAIKNLAEGNTAVAVRLLKLAANDSAFKQRYIKTAQYLA